MTEQRMTVAEAIERLGGIESARGSVRWQLRPGSFVAVLALHAIDAYEQSQREQQHVHFTVKEHAGNSDPVFLWKVFRDDRCIHRYLGSVFHWAGEPGDKIIKEWPGKEGSTQREEVKPKPWGSIHIAVVRDGVIVDRLYIGACPPFSPKPKRQLCDMEHGDELQVRVGDQDGVVSAWVKVPLLPPMEREQQPDPEREPQPLPRRTPRFVFGSGPDDAVAEPDPEREKLVADLERCIESYADERVLLATNRVGSGNSDLDRECLHTAETRMGQAIERLAAHGAPPADPEREKRIEEWKADYRRMTTSLLNLIGVLGRGRVDEVERDALVLMRSAPSTELLVETQLLYEQLQKAEDDYDAIRHQMCDIQEALEVAPDESTLDAIKSLRENLAEAEHARDAKEVVLDAIHDTLREAGYEMPLQEQVGAAIKERDDLREKLAAAEAEIAMLTNDCNFWLESARDHRDRAKKAEARPDAVAMLRRVRAAMVTKWVIEAKKQHDPGSELRVIARAVADELQDACSEIDRLIAEAEGEQS